MEEKEKDGFDKYEVEEGFRSLMAAEKIKKNPKLLAAVKKHAEEQGEALAAIQAHSAGSKSVKDLKALRDKK